TGLFPLTLWNRGLSQIVARPSIKSVWELKGLKITANSDLASSTLTALGALASTTDEEIQIRTASSLGTSDASEFDFPKTAIASFKAVEAQTVIAGFRPIVGVLAASPKYWENASEAVKQTIDAAADAASMSSRKAILQAEAANKKAIEGTKVRYLQFNKEQLE